MSLCSRVLGKNERFPQLRGATAALPLAHPHLPISLASERREKAAGGIKATAVAAES